MAIKIKKCENCKGKLSKYGIKYCSRLIVSNSEHRKIENLKAKRNKYGQYA